MEEMCFVCSKSLSEGPTVLVHRGLQTLRDASIERNDGKIEHLRNVNSIKCHVQCRKDYTRKSSILAVKKVPDKGASTSTSSPTRIMMRSSEPVFNFKENCIFCGEEANEVKEKKINQECRPEN